MMAMTIRGWNGQEARRVWLRDRLRQGYADLHGYNPQDTVEVWLEQWRELADPTLADADTLAELGERVGLPGLIGPWFDNLVEIGRWVDPARAPEVFASFERMLQRFEGRFTREPERRILAVRATAADLLRVVGDDRGCERLYGQLRDTFPRSARPIIALVDSRLDFGVAGTTLRQDLQGCEKLLARALYGDLDDIEEAGVRNYLESVQMDLAHVERFKVERWLRQPNFEVWAWPAPTALWELDPELFDDFYEGWS